MPIIAHNQLPTFARLKAAGALILPANFAQQQDIREMHIGLLNMMPDAALEATERQFYRLIGSSNQIAQFYIHPFTLDSIPRGDKATIHIKKYYENFSDIKQKGLDALIITGANVTHPNLQDEPFWKQLIEVINWAETVVTSTITSCLATHAVMQFRYQQRRTALKQKCWGVYQHHIVKSHPLVNEVNSQFNVPHSRYNQITKKQCKEAGLMVLVSSQEAGVHLMTSEDGFKIVMFQGHPEYDAISLLKEYKRETALFFAQKRITYPPFPKNYFNQKTQTILREYQYYKSVKEMDFPEKLIANMVQNTWHDTASAIIGNWIGLVYQVTHPERNRPYMDGISSQNPLNL